MAQSAAGSAQAGIGKRDCGISNKQRDAMQRSGCFACDNCPGARFDQCLYLQLKTFECWQSIPARAINVGAIRQPEQGFISNICAFDVPVQIIQLWLGTDIFTRMLDLLLRSGLNKAIGIVSPGRHWFGHTPRGRLQAFTHWN